MKLVTSLILIAFVSLSLLGFVAMLGPEMHHTASACLGSLAQNGACPPLEHTLASAIFHTNALKVFSTTLLSSAFILASLLLFFGFLTSRAQQGLFLHVFALCAISREFVRIRCASFFRLREALSRLELSPSFV